MDLFLRRPALRPHRRPAPCRGGRRRRHDRRPPHEPPVSGRRGQRQDHGGRRLRLVRRPERLAVGPDGPHGDPGPPALTKTLSPLMARLRPDLRPAHRLHPCQGAPRHAGGTASRRHHRPVHRYPRPADGGRAVYAPGSGDHR